ncbi:hypothetical protein PR003_g25673 [Phytophthora rubi]|uniref:Uncharacterized protein n=1 Tax=Phytophthora rubi TaxID=129364 RepID=A0A6A4CGW7_9STRA|nr:hypothetical protein PR003_g25673 [Phytophthora rubi]
MYWESLQNEEDEGAEPPQNRERKRPNVASYITEVVRGAVKAMPPSVSQAITPNMTSHSIRRGAAAYANASPKLAIQWISTRGAWLLESLTKAFAYIGTTTKEDQSVAKVLAGFQAPDLPATIPSIRDLHHRLSATEYGQLITLRDELYHHVLGFQDARFNIALDVVDATFASLLMHLEAVLEATESSESNVLVGRYVYELNRGISATNSRLGSCITTRTCCEWGKHLRVHWQTTNHGQLGNAVAGGDSLLSSTLENMLAQLVSINERLGRLEDAHAKLSPCIDDANQPAEGSAPTGTIELTAPAPATASTLAGSMLNWYTNHIWETVKGKKEQNQRAEAKAVVNIMSILYQAPYQISQEPSRSDPAAYQRWKDNLWTLALAMDSAVNERLHSFDHKKHTRKASSLRKRWRLLRTSHPEAYRTFGSQFLALKASGAIVDACTPMSHQRGTSHLA